MLSGKEIKKNVDEGLIVIKPFSLDQLNPNSYNVTLHPKLKAYDLPRCHGVLDSKRDNPFYEIEIPPAGFILVPGVLYIGRTVEYTETYNLVPRYDGRSSTGRLGIFSHVTAGFGDVGFCGTWTLEIVVIHPVRVYPNMKIGQLSYCNVVGETTDYDGKYQNQIDATPSRLFLDRVD